MAVTRVAVSVIVSAELGASAIGCSDDGGGRGTARPTLTLAPVSDEDALPPVELVDNKAGTTPRLTAEQARTVEEIIKADPVIAGLVGGSTMVISRVHPVIADHPVLDKFLLLAGSADVTLSPVSHDSFDAPFGEVRDGYAAWPDDLKTRYPVFTSNVVTLRLENVSEFDATVDFQTRRVVSIGFVSGSGTEQVEYAGPSIEAPSADTSRDNPDSQRVKSIAENDAAVATILEALDTDGSFAYRYDWGDHKFGYFEARTENGAALDGDWPQIIDQDRVTGDYRSEVIHLATGFAREVNVIVDLDLERVISIRTSEGD